MPWVILCSVSILVCLCIKSPIYVFKILTFIVTIHDMQAIFICNIEEQHWLVIAF